MSWFLKTSARTRFLSACNSQYIDKMLSSCTTYDSGPMSTFDFPRHLIFCNEGALVIGALRPHGLVPRNARREHVSYRIVTHNTSIECSHSELPTILDPCLLLTSLGTSYLATSVHRLQGLCVRISWFLETRAESTFLIGL